MTSTIKQSGLRCERTTRGTKDFGFAKDPTSSRPAIRHKSSLVRSAGLTRRLLCLQSSMLGLRWNGDFARSSKPLHGHSQVPFIDASGPLDSDSTMVQVTTGVGTDVGLHDSHTTASLAALPPLSRLLNTGMT